MGDGLHVTVGPAAIYWRDADTASGNYHIVAKITQMQNPAHQKATGSSWAARASPTPAKATRTSWCGGGRMYSIRRRAGYAARPTAVVEWTASDAVVKADSTGKATNELSVQVRGGRVSFMVNGKEVYAADATGLDTRGVVGYSREPQPRRAPRAAGGPQTVTGMAHADEERFSFTPFTRHPFFTQG